MNNKKTFWETDTGKRTWAALLTKQISQSEAARLPGAPGQSAISQRMIKYQRMIEKQGHQHSASPYQAKDPKTIQVTHNKCPVCSLVSEFEGLRPEDKVRFRRLLATERNV